MAQAVISRHSDKLYGHPDTGNLISDLFQIDLLALAFLNFRQVNCQAAYRPQKKRVIVPGQVHEAAHLSAVKLCQPAIANSVNMYM